MRLKLVYTSPQAIYEIICERVKMYSNVFSTFKFDFSNVSIMYFNFIFNDKIVLFHEVFIISVTKNNKINHF